MKLEPFSSIAYAGWLPLWLELWPDCPREQHLREMASFTREPGQHAQFVVRSEDGQGLGFAESEWAVAQGCVELAPDTQHENRDGSRRLAAPGQSGYPASAAIRHLPPPSAPLEGRAR